MQVLRIHRSIDSIDALTRFKHEQKLEEDFDPSTDNYKSLSRIGCYICVRRKGLEISICRWEKVDVHELAKLAYAALATTCREELATARLLVV